MIYGWTFTASNEELVLVGNYTREQAIAAAESIGSLWSQWEPLPITEPTAFIRELDD